MVDRDVSSRKSDKIDWMERDLVTIKEEVKYLRGEVQEGNLNIARLLRFLMPHEKKLKLPPNMPTPTLHVSNLDDFDKINNFLEEKVNFDAVVSTSVCLEFYLMYLGDSLLTISIFDRLNTWDSYQLARRKERRQ